MPNHRRFAPDAPAWRFARAALLVGFGGFAWALVVRPEAALLGFWAVVVPVLPAVLLLDARVWRNVCPLATLNVLTGARSGGGRQSTRMGRFAGAGGILLLALLVPSRHVGLDESAPGLLGLLVVLGIVALVTGRGTRMKGGFCNAMCPILPVERLYGRHPALAVPNARCSRCEACSTACFDLNPNRSARSLLPRAPDRPWSLTPFGAFVAAFPGFVLSYFVMPKGIGVLGVYGVTIGLSGLSWMVFTALFGRHRRFFDVGMTLSATIAASIYYWFVPIQVAEAFGFSNGFVATSRLIAALFIAYAGWRSWASVGPSYSSSSLSTLAAKPTKLPHGARTKISSIP